MPRIFKKTHFWKDKRTYLDLNADEPRLEKGFPKEGAVTLKIGDQDGLKAAFKMQVDEVRAFRDVLNLFIEKHDKEMCELHFQQYSNYSQSQMSSSEPVKEEVREPVFSQQAETKEEPAKIFEMKEPKSEEPQVFSFGGDDSETEKTSETKSGLTLFEKSEEEKDKPALKPYY